MKRVLTILICSLGLLACAAAPRTPQKPEDPHTLAQEHIEKASSLLAERQSALREKLQHKPAPAIEMVPVMPVYDPLEDQMVSFSMTDESIQAVLYALAKAVGMNLILDPSVQKEDRRLTLNFENVSAAD